MEIEEGDGARRARTADAPTPQTLPTLSTTDEDVTPGPHEGAPTGTERDGSADPGASGEGPAPNAPAPRLTRPTYFADRLPPRMRRREDLLHVAFSLIGIVVVWALGYFANATTEGVTEDVLRFRVIRDILLLPVTLVEGAVVLIAPIAVIVSLARRRRLATILESLLTASVTAAVGWLVLVVLRHLPDVIGAPLRVTSGTTSVIALNLVLTTLVALFTSAGETSNMKTVRRAWWALWLITFLGVIRGSMTLPGALIAILLGRACGSLARWVLGFDDRRATGVDLVAGLLSIGIVPSRIIRTDLDTDTEPLDTWTIEEQPPQEVGQSPRLRQYASDVDLVEYTVTRAPERNDNRHYQAWDQTGNAIDVVVLDPGGEVTGTVVEVWNNLRLRGISRWISPSLKANAERSTLTALTALRAGVHVPEPLGLAEAGDSLLLVNRALPPTSTLREAPVEVVTDELLDQVWSQLVLAHSRSVAHRNLAFDSVVVDQMGTVWIVDWEQGEVAASELNRRIDIAQLLVHLAVCVGPDRALASARRAIPESELQASAPVLQGAVLPSSVNAAVRRSDIVADLRTQLVGGDPQSSAQLLDIQRFAPRTVIMAAVAAIAVIVVLGSMNFDDIAAAVTSAQPLWILAAFLLASLTWVGAAIPLLSFSPEKLRFGDALLAQIAASIVTIVAPAGIGPAALNLRYLNKQKVSTPMAVTTVTMQQISQFLTTVLILLLVLVFTGNSLSVNLPYSTILAVAGVLVIAVTVSVSVPRLRHWIWEKVEPTWRQVYPRLLWIVGQPRRVAGVLAGNVIMNIGFIGAFWASLRAFGGNLNLTTLTITYLASNSLGSVIPSPGGIGPVEAALTGGLQVAGIPVSVALSTALVYRLVTFYGRVPFGWAAMKIMERKDLL